MIKSFDFYKIIENVDDKRAIGGVGKKNTQGRLHCIYRFTKDNIEDSCRDGPDKVLSTLDQQYNRYRLAEGQLVRAQQSIVGKIPEIEKTIQMVEALSSNKSKVWEM